MCDVGEKERADCAQTCREWVDNEVMTWLVKRLHYKWLS